MSDPTANHYCLTLAWVADFADMHVDEFHHRLSKMQYPVSLGYVSVVLNKPPSQRPTKGLPRDLWVRTHANTFAVREEYRSDPRILRAIRETTQFVGAREFEQRLVG